MSWTRSGTRYSIPPTQAQFLHPHGPGMYGTERSDHPDPGFAFQKERLDSLSNQDWHEYMNGQSGPRNASDKQAHGRCLPLRSKRTNASYLTKASQPFQDDEDEWVQHYKTLYGFNDRDALHAAYYSVREDHGGAPRSYMTPDVLMRRQLGDQARVRKRKPAAKKPKKIARPRRHGVPNCGLV